MINLAKPERLVSLQIRDHTLMPNVNIYKCHPKNYGMAFENKNVLPK